MMESPGSLNYYNGSHWFMSAVAVGLIGLFSLWLLDALQDAEESAEKMVVESTVRNMRVGLKIAMGEAMIAGHENEIAQWGGSNPVRWLDGPPAGYLGDCQADSVLPPASWCFDVAYEQLLYRPRHQRRLRLSGGMKLEKKILRWQVPRPAGEATSSRFVGVTVQLVTPYVWLLE